MQINKEKMTVELSVSEINRITVYLNTIDQTKKNKLTYAATQLGDEIESKTKAYVKKSARLSYEYAQKDDEGNFKSNKDGGLIIEPKKILEYHDKKDELAESTMIELDLYYCNDNELIEKLPITTIKALNGILFDYDMSALQTNQK